MNKLRISLNKCTVCSWCMPQTCRQKVIDPLRQVAAGILKRFNLSIGNTTGRSIAAGWRTPKKNNPKTFLNTIHYQPRSRSATTPRTPHQQQLAYEVPKPEIQKPWGKVIRLIFPKGIHGLQPVSMPEKLRDCLRMSVWESTGKVGHKARATKTWSQCQYNASRSE